MRIFLTVVVLCSFYLSSVGNVVAMEKDKTYRLIFSTFDAKSANDYAYLRDSIQTMLMSRLAAHENIEVIDRVLTQDELISLSQKEFRPITDGIADADYVVSGSLFALATGLDVQVSMYPTDPKESVMNFSHLAKTSADIIAGCDQLIATILQGVLGEEPIPVESVEVEQDPVSGFTTVHPEEEYKRRLHSGMVDQSE